MRSDCLYCDVFNSKGGAKRRCDLHIVLESADNVGGTLKVLLRAVNVVMWC